MRSLPVAGSREMDPEEMETNADGINTNKDAPAEVKGTLSLRMEIQTSVKVWINETTYTAAAIACPSSWKHKLMKRENKRIGRSPRGVVTPGICCNFNHVGLRWEGRTHYKVKWKTNSLRRL
jgi:hypothetical protein